MPQGLAVEAIEPLCFGKVRNNIQSQAAKIHVIWHLFGNQLTLPLPQDHSHLYQLFIRCSPPHSIESIGQYLVHVLFFPVKMGLLFTTARPASSHGQHPCTGPDRPQEIHRDLVQALVESSQWQPTEEALHALSALAKERHGCRGQGEGGGRLVGRLVNGF